MNKTEDLLASKYRKIFKNKNPNPKWAYKKKSNQSELIHCAIPFVGHNYLNSSPKILLYASAENLTGYNGHLDNDNKALYRHRDHYESSIGKDFFPDVHIAPITDGSLLVVTLYCLKQIGFSKALNSPRDLIELISFANFCKYSIYSKKNKDYANNINKLSESLEYVKADIEILLPDILILPKSIYEHNKIKTELLSYKKNMQIIPIYQINASVINRTIKKKYKKKRGLDGDVRKWYSQLGKNSITGKTKENFLSVFTYIDSLFINQKKSNNCFDLALPLA